MSLVLDQILVQNSKIKSLLCTIYTVSFVTVIKFILQKVSLNCGLYLFLYSKVKSLGAADSDDDDSASSWVAKSRKKENEKSLAEKRVSSYNLEKVLNFNSHLEKSLNWLIHLHLAELNIVAVTENVNTSHFQIHFQIWVVLLIGCATWEICFNQSEALRRSG